jgi:hypothetical protein
MKKNFWLLSAVVSLTATVVLAQDTNSATPAPAATTAPSPEPPAKAHRRKPTAIKTSIAMNPPAAASVKGDDVNVRGQPSFVGEVLGHLQKDAALTVLEKLTLNHPPTGEPPEWLKIVMPTNIPVWVDAEYIDAGSKSVKVRRVNLRGGPGENYSVVGRLEKGAKIDELREEKGWLSIAAPTNAYAFIAAELVEIQAAPAPAAEAPAPAPAPEIVAVTNTQPAPVLAAPVAPAPTAQTEAAQELSALHQTTPAEPVTPPVTEPAPAPAAAEPATPRIVTREGFVHRSYNIQSPADLNYTTSKAEC